MYKLDLETLTEERLRKNIDTETYQLGVDLLNRNMVQVVNVADFNASMVVTDKRRYQVDIKISRDTVLLKCTCSHASRGLICEHEVAGWLGLRQHLARLLPAPWQTQLSQIIGSAGAIPRRSKSPAYFLFFSLQEDQRGMSPFWRISPYTLAYNALPAELRHTETPLDNAALQRHLQETPGAARSLKTPYYSLDPEACLNCGREAVDLANIILERNRAYAYSYNATFPLENFLAPLRKTDGPLYLGESSQPLSRALHVHARPGELRLDVSRENDGLRLAASLASLEAAPLRFLAAQPVGEEGDEEPVQDQPEIQTSIEPNASRPAAGRRLDVNLKDIQVILADPYWLLAGSELIELANPSGLSLLDFFSETNELAIPAYQVENFTSQYMLDLARRFPIQGDAIEWEVVDAEPLPRLYLTDQNTELQANLRFAYTGLEVRYDPDYPEKSVQHRPDSLTLVHIRRRPESEKAAYEALASASFGLKRAALPSQPGLFRLRARTHPVDFLLNSVPRLAQSGFEVYGEEQLKTARVNRNSPTIAFKVTSGIDWFDVKAVVNFGDLEVALPEVRRALRKRERYIKLADGSIGEIPEEWIERYKHLFSLGDVEGESLRFSRHHITLIEQALEDADGTDADEEFNRRRLRLRALIDQKFSGNGSVSRSDNGSWITSRPLPEGFQGELRHYQKAGYDWLHFLREFEFGGCLADDMGLGKTIQTLVFLQSLYSREKEMPRGGNGSAPAAGSRHTERLPASLLVVPRSLLVNWQRESERFTPDLRILEFFDTDRVKDMSQFNDVDLVITTYGVLLRDIQLLHGYTFHYAILDESQAIKNPGSQTARAAHLLRAQHRLVLTGTPIENSTSELWSQFAFLNPGLLGSLQYFKTEFGLPIEKKGDAKAAESLRKLVYPFILRRTKAQVAPELPPRTEKIVYCDMEPAQRKLYNKTRDFYRGIVLGMLDKEGMNASRMKILEGLLRLRQICNHPHLVDEKFHGTSAKFEVLIETLETLRAENHKALVFSQFVKMLTLVRKEMDTREMIYTYLDGRTTARQEQVDRFQGDPNIPFFLISLRAGGLGLNLTAADYVIHIDPWWNPAVEMQASDRTHRIGQDKPVFVFKLIARDSVEEKILLLQDRKRNLVDQVITTENAFFKSLTREDIEELFTG